MSCTARALILGAAVLVALSACSKSEPVADTNAAQNAAIDHLDPLAKTPPKHR
jgi:hypothetical protein